MIKKIIFFALLLSYNNVFSQENDVDIINASPEHNLKSTELADYKLKGDVKSIINLVYEPVEKFGEISKGKIVIPLFGSNEDNYKIKFNKSGLITQYVRFDEKGVRSYSTDFEYNSENNQKEIKSTNSNDVITLLQRFEYNISNQTISEYNQYWEKDVSINEYKYNSKSQLISMIRDNGIDKTDYIFTYSYTNDKLSKILMETRNGNFESLKKIYFLGENISEIKEMNEEGELIRHSKFKFDKNNNLIYKITTEEGKNELSETFFQYNKNSHLIERKWKNFETNFVYNYDKNSNWISKIIYINGIPKYIISREIDYYN